jgi:hypothetical protein
VRRNGNHNNGSIRFSCYLSQADYDIWIEERDKVAEAEGIRYPDNGTFFLRWVRNLRLDQASINGYVKTHKRRRDQDPARMKVKASKA